MLCQQLRGHLNIHGGEGCHILACHPKQPQNFLWFFWRISMSLHRQFLSLPGLHSHESQGGCVGTSSVGAAQQGDGQRVTRLTHSTAGHVWDPESSTVTQEFHSTTWKIRTKMVRHSLPGSQGSRQQTSRSEWKLCFRLCPHTEVRQESSQKRTADKHLMLMSVALPYFKFLLPQGCMIYCFAAPTPGFESVISFEFKLYLYLFFFVITFFLLLL